MRLLSRFENAANREIELIEDDDSLSDSEKSEMIKEILRELEEIEMNLSNDQYWDER